MSEPTVSICVPTYNGEAYLAECLESVLAQSFQNFEVVITDDCSRDATVEIAQRYSQRDSRIRVVCYEKNSGGGGAGNYNRCLEQARGTWLKFLFQDDLLAPACLERMLDQTREGARFISCWRDFLFDEHSSDALREQYLQAESLQTLFTKTTITPEEMCHVLLAHWPTNIIGEPVATLVHRDCFARYGAFNPELINTADLECWIRIASHEGVTVVPEVLAIFRVHEGSTSANNRKRRLRVQLEDVLLSLALANAPEFDKLREAAHRGGLDIKAMIATAARGARWLAVDARASLGDNTFMDEWERFSLDHPAVAEILRKADVERAGPWPRIKTRMNRWFGGH